MYAYAQSKVEICGVNTAKLQTLKNDEMRELLDRSHHGDKDARDKLICGNLRLVLSVSALQAAAKTRMTSFRWAASGSSKPSIISTQATR